MASVPFALALGVVLGLVAIRLDRAGRQLRLRRRFRAFARRWRALDRGARRRIIRAIRTGHGVPAEHAAITLEQLALGDLLFGERMPTLRRRALRATLYNLAGLGAAVILVYQRKVFIIGDTEVQIGYAFVGFFATLNAVQALWWLRAPRRIARAVANRASARAEAERYLETASLSSPEAGI